MPNFTNEKMLSLYEAATLIPSARHGKQTYFSLLRWIKEGSRGPRGKRVRLEALRVGGRWMTSREALQRFAERLTPKLEVEVPL